MACQLYYKVTVSQYRILAVGYSYQADFGLINELKPKYNLAVQSASTFLKTICCVLFLSFLLAACSEEAVSPTPDITRQAISTAEAVASLTAAVPTPEPTATPTPVPATVPPPTGSPAPAGSYGPLPAPPRSLNPKAELFASGPPAKSLPKLSFVVATNNGLYVLGVQGENEKLLAGGASFNDPQVAPDSLRVTALRTDPLTRAVQLVLVDTAGGSKIIAPEGGGAFLAANWSPDSKTLALTRVGDSNGDGLADEFDSPAIVLYEVATGKQQNLTEGGYPSWSPDGLRLAYLIAGPVGNDIDPATRPPRRGPNSLGVYNFSTKAKRVLREAKGLELDPLGTGYGAIPPTARLSVRYFKAVAWHPDNKHITASADVTGPNSLRAGVVVALTLDNPALVVLTAAGDAAGRLSWSKDGRNLAYEVLPQFPVRPTSANGIGIVEAVQLTLSRPTKVLLGNPATRREARRPQWLGDGPLAFLEGDRAVLTITEADGQRPRRLVADCNGFAWV